MAFIFFCSMFVHPCLPLNLFSWQLLYNGLTYFKILVQIYVTLMRWSTWHKNHLLPQKVWSDLDGKGQIGSELFFGTLNITLKRSSSDIVHYSTLGHCRTFGCMIQDRVCGTILYMQVKIKTVSRTSTVGLSARP